MYNLQLYNFQRFKNQSITLKGFVVIEGQSNLGKSSIRRALGTVTQNIWDASFVAKGSKNTKINLETDDIQISCTKGTANEFIILKAGKRAEYNKAGKDIPKEIIASGFSPLVVGKDKINLLIAKQYDPLFMVSYSDAMNTKILNTVFDVDTLEKANELVIKDIVSNKRELKRELQVSEDKSKELDEVSITLEKMKKLQAIYERLDLIDNFEDCKDELMEVSTSFKYCKDKMAKVNKLISLHKTYIQASELQVKRETYQSLSIKLNRATKQLQLISINDKLIALRDLKECSEDKLENLNNMSINKDSLDRVYKADSLYKQLVLIIKVEKVHYEKYTLDKRLADITKSQILIKGYNQILFLDSLPSLKARLEDKKLEQDAVFKNIELQEEEIKAIGYCPCCGQPIKK